MTISLPVASPDTFVERSLRLGRRGVSAIVVDDACRDTALRQVRAKLQALPVAFAEATLDERLLQPRETLRAHAAEAVILPSRSSEQSLWRTIDKHRSRLEQNQTILFLLSPAAAECLVECAPNLASLLGGALWAYAPCVDNEVLRFAIERAAGMRYAELYEPVDDRQLGRLDEVVRDALVALGDPRRDDRAWRTHGTMVRAMLVEVLPTIAGHWPAGTDNANQVLASLDAWLASSSEPPPLRAAIASPTVPQALAEAMEVVRYAQRVMVRSEARQSAEEIVDLCMQGYAIFPGSAGRRTLFDWWLETVLPSAHSLERPNIFDRNRR